MSLKLLLPEDFTKSIHTTDIIQTSVYNSKNNWDVCINNPFQNCDKVAPRQQKKVAEFLDAVCENKNINSVTVFGSSVTKSCHIDSDLELYVELKKDEKIDLPLFTFPFDLWTNYTVNSKMLNEINKKGVLVYG